MAFPPPRATAGHPWGRWLCPIWLRLPTSAGSAPWSMSYSSDLTDEQWALLAPVFNMPGQRGPKHAPDLRRVVDAMLCVSHTGASGGTCPSRPGRGRACGRSSAAGRAEPTPLMIVIDTHLARGASNGGFSFHDRGRPYGRTRGAKRVVAVDVHGPAGRCTRRAGLHPREPHHRTNGATPPPRGRHRTARAGAGGTQVQQQPSALIARQLRGCTPSPWRPPSQLVPATARSR